MNLAREALSRLEIAVAIGRELRVPACLTPMTQHPMGNAKSRVGRRVFWVALDRFLEALDS